MGRSSVGGGVVDHRRGDLLDVTSTLALQDGDFFVASLFILAIQLDLLCLRSENTHVLALEGPSSTNASHPQSKADH